LVTPAEINDAQAAIAKTKLGVNVEAFIIGAPMRHRVRGALQRLPVGRGSRTIIENSADSAHIWR
jgi:hypothetical protein